ncbi:hypothetical protein AXG93_4101s1100 [Marchantia polymorpha subsp. ruderalis]|uniref:USP domain-containing protein n=1 Tax=Marchantia polymorpha subsp. ruderalis TaxID=1480154 RepID=A0A176VC82_MARPO|nr:hypothetical protein AXG93_4101s1100 [Marchantia polymorpha subsp. ruderalis]
MAAAKMPEVGLGVPGAWTQRRIAFHATSTFSSAPAMEPLNDPVSGNGSGAGPAAAAAAGSLLANKLSKQNPQRLPSSMPLQWPTAQKIGAGLSNLGNTCFLNSVLQCLTYTPPLAGYLQSGQHKLSCRVAGFCAFCALQEHVSQALTSSGRVVAPNKLAKNLRSISRSFRMCRQEDAHEYMRYLLEALHKCCIPPELASTSSSNPKPSQDKSLVYKIFGGRLRSQVKCSVCYHCSNTYDPFLDLSLDIVRADSLTKALTRFTAVDTLDGDNKYRCAHCKKKVRAQKQFTIETVPNILTIQFKRFSSTGSMGGKIDKKVDFGTTLDMKPFSSSQVRQVSERTVLEQKAYMLFYVREVKREAIPPAQSAPKAVPAPAPVSPPVIAAPAVIVTPKETKIVSSPTSGEIVLPKTSIVVNNANGAHGSTQEVEPALKPALPTPSEVVAKLPSPEPEASSLPVLAVPEVAVAGEPCIDTAIDKTTSVEASCTTSGIEIEAGAEADWDEHYKSGMNSAVGTPQNMLKLLRAMPRTRRYFMARAMQRANRGLPIQSTSVVAVEASSSAVRKDAKRRLSVNGEVSGNKRQQKDSSEGGSSVSVITSAVPSEKADQLKPIDQTEIEVDDAPNNLREKDSLKGASVNRPSANGLSNGHADKVDDGNKPVKNPVENGNGGSFHSASSADHDAEAVNTREGHHSAAELRDERSDPPTCQPIEVENGGPREHSHGNGANMENGSKNTNGSAHLTYKDDLYGVGVPRWNEDANGEKEVDRLLRESEKAPTPKQDLWDAEYDRGRSKKVRSKMVVDSESAEPTSGRENACLKSENPFQAHAYSKLGNGTGNGNGNGKRVGNGIGNGHSSGNGSKPGKYGVVGPQSAKRRFN